MSESDMIRIRKLDTSCLIGNVFVHLSLHVLLMKCCRFGLLE